MPRDRLDNLLRSNMRIAGAAKKQYCGNLTGVAMMG
jgi:hypothetical protein